MKIHPIESAVALLLAVVCDLVVLSVLVDSRYGKMNGKLIVHTGG